MSTAVTEPPQDGSTQPQPASSSSTPEPDSSTEQQTMKVSDLLYCVSSFYAIVTPVTITMILSALAVVFINTDESKQAGQENTSSAYLALDVDDSSSTGQKIGVSLINSLVIVAVICALTFLIVLLYKYRCMILLMGYMILASTMLLGFLSAVMIQVAVDKYQWNLDKLTFYWGLVNFAVVGTLAIFYGKGIPMYITQSYLVLTSVILAWQLSYFDEWTAWALLVLLALYDLFAVLTPCGPLKALVKLMQRENAPQMPGLLYEASLPVGAHRRDTNNNSNAATAATNTDTRNNTVQVTSTRRRNTLQSQGEPSDDPPTTATPTTATPTTANTPQQETNGDVELPMRQQCEDRSIEVSITPIASSSRTVEHLGRPQRGPVGQIPLAIARLYKLSLAEPIALLVPAQWADSARDDADIPTETNQPHQFTMESFTLAQLCSTVQAVFPAAGGSIRRLPEHDNEPRYEVRDRHGNVKRILVVNDQGRVFEFNEQIARQNERAQRSTIKLGLGDFIFYSVLVAKAAEYSFTAFVVCVLVILTGLGATLVLLAVFGKALPALPISIFLGVAFYLLTRFLLEPFVHGIFEHPVYV